MNRLTATVAILALVIPSALAPGGPDGFALQTKSLADAIHGNTLIFIEKPSKEKFPLAEGLDAAGWFQVDLSKSANRTTVDNNRGGWISEGPKQDLRRLSAGMHTYYGVPFSVLDCQNGAKPNCIATASQHISVSQAPERVSVEVGRPARVLYFLAACAWSTMKQNYEVTAHYADGTADKFQINPAGVLRGQYENIHEWANSDEVIETPVSRPVVLPLDNTAAGIANSRTIYVLEWPIPKPDKTIIRLEVAGDKDYQATVIIMAITGHK